MFDTSTDQTAANDTISTTASAMGLRRDRAGYQVLDLWTGQSTTVPSSGTIIASVPSEGVALYRVTPR
jgi:hypothetical protein